jgi:hypothetical protein
MKIGHFFCPFLNFPNTFGKRKREKFSSHVGNFLPTIFCVFLSLCSEIIFLNFFAPNSRQKLNVTIFLFMIIIYMNTSTLVVILLTILSILVFLKTAPYIFLSSDMLNVDKYLNIDFEPHLNIFDPNDILQNLGTFSLIILATTIIYKRNFQNDIINFIMYYLIIINILRFYFVFFSQSQLTGLTFQTVSKITIISAFFLSLYIIKYIFF